MGVKKYIKKPVIVEAIQWVWDNWSDIMQFIPIPDVLYIPDEEQNKEKPKLKIKTLEGTMNVNYGDYILKGIKGEFYPCRADIFEETYREKTFE